MADARVDYEITASKKVLSLIESMLEAVADEWLYSIELEHEEKKLMVYDEAGDLGSVLELVGVINTALSENEVSRFSYNIKGVVDYGYFEYDAFALECSKSKVQKKTLHFSVPRDDSMGTDEWHVLYEKDEDEAHKELESQSWQNVSEGDLEYDDSYYETANDALVEKLEEYE